MRIAARTAETAAGQPLGAIRLDSGAAVSGNVVMTANAAIANEITPYKNGS